MSTGFQSLENVVRFYADLQIETLYFKVLAANDNTKNQVYFGPGFRALTLFPMGEISPDPSAKNPIFKAPLNFQWIADDLSLAQAPNAQVILYPQYPEIRFSGFLKGAERAHLGSIRNLMNSRLAGRILLLGVHNAGHIIGSVFEPSSLIAQQFSPISQTLTKATEIFFELQTSAFLGKGIDPRKKLIEELSRIHSLGWIDSKRLDGEGNLLPCTAPQCGGYTLEAELGVTPNGRSEPDYFGWEVKQHTGNVLTLMTPEPNGGFYVEQGVEQFVRAYGYPDKLGRKDRLNFGGTHYCNERHSLTNLTIKLVGYDSTKNKIIDQNGGIALVDDNGTVAASWAFAGILSHWNRKHRNTVYVSSKHRTEPANQYSYENIVLLGEGTDPLLLLDAFHKKKVYYDPGIKLENASSLNPTSKRRSQFRVKLKDLDGLYYSLTQVDVTA